MKTSIPCFIFILAVSGFSSRLWAQQGPDSTRSSCEGAGGNWLVTDRVTEGVCSYATKTTTPTTSDSAASASPSASELIQQCVSKAQSLLDACASQQSSATSTCDADSNSTLSAGAAKAEQLTSTVTSSEVQASCSDMASASQSAISSLNTFKNNCSSAITSCTNACVRAQDSMDDCGNDNGVNVQGASAYQQASAHSSTCGALQSTVSTASSLVDKYTTLQSQAKTCKNDSSGGQSNAASTAAGSSTDSSNTASTTTTTTTAKPTYYLSNGTCYAGGTGQAVAIANCNSATTDNGWGTALASIATAVTTALTKTAATTTNTIVDCTDSTMLTNTVCICVKDPTNAVCGKTQTSTQEGITGTGGGISTATTAAAALDLGADDSGLTLQQPTNRAADENVGGKQGNGANVGYGGGGSAGTPTTANGAAKAGGAGGTPTYSGGGGYYGSGSAGEGGSSSGGNSGSAGLSATSSGGRAPASFGGTVQKMEAPDLRQFLPGGVRDPQRNIAGTAGPDGITGPNTDQWKKVQNRYQELSDSLLPNGDSLKLWLNRQQSLFVLPALNLAKVNSW